VLLESNATTVNVFNHQELPQGHQRNAAHDSVRSVESNYLRKCLDDMLGCTSRLPLYEMHSVDPWTDNDTGRRMPAY
jgi:hypothetical protein